MRISKEERVENHNGTEPRDGFLEPKNGVVARGPTEDGRDWERVVRPIPSGSPPGVDNKASEDGIKGGRAKDMNFSHFLRPTRLKVTKPRVGDGDLPELGCSSGLVGKARVTGAQHQTCGPEQKVDISPDADPSRNLCNDKRFSESSSMLASNLEGKRARGVELARGTPMCVGSYGTSNDPKVVTKGRYEDCQALSQSDSDSEDSGRFDAKVRRNSADRSSKRSRKERINKSMHNLQELLPNCNEVDDAGVLDKAIEHLRTLQQQLLVQSSGSPMYPSPPMMLPAGIQQMYAPYPYPYPYRTQFPPLNIPRGMSLGLQFPTTTAASGLPAVPPPVSSSLRRSSSPSLSLDSSRPTDTIDDLLDSGSSSDDQS